MRIVYNWDIIFKYNGVTNDQETIERLRSNVEELQWPVLSGTSEQ